MMLRRTLILGLMLLPAATALAAEDYAQSVVRQLRAQGYGQIEVTSTLLGRTRITAQRGKAWREIILNPHTGEILRDLRQEAGEVRIDEDEDEDEDEDQQHDSADQTGDDDKKDGSGKGGDDKSGDDKDGDDKGGDDKGGGDKGGGDKSGPGGGDD